MVALKSLAFHRKTAGTVESCLFMELYNNTSSERSSEPRKCLEIGYVIDIVNVMSGERHRYYSILQLKL